MAPGFDFKVNFLVLTIPDLILKRFIQKIKVNMSTNNYMDESTPKIILKEKQLNEKRLRFFNLKSD